MWRTEPYREARAAEYDVARATSVREARKWWWERGVLDSVYGGRVYRARGRARGRAKRTWAA